MEGNSERNIEAIKDQTMEDDPSILLQNAQLEIQSLKDIIKKQEEEKLDMAARVKLLGIKSRMDDLIFQKVMQDENLEFIKSQLDSGMNINTPITTEGPFAGYTILHFAYMKKSSVDLIELLRSYEEADFNAEADDGVQPVHLVCFFHPDEIHNLKKNINFNVTITRDIFLKYFENEEWCADFGDEISLLTYAVLYKKDELGSGLIKNGANVNIKSLTNKPLMMYAFDNSVYVTCTDMVINGDIKDLISTFNYQDDDGVPLLLYPLHPKKFGKYRYDSRECSSDASSVISTMIFGGADKYLLINDDPEMFLINLAAYRGYHSTLRRILPLYKSIELSKALYYATLPVDEDADNYLQIHPGDDKEVCLDELRESRDRCIKEIIVDLRNRITFGLSVPQDEIDIMNHLIDTDENINSFVEDYDKEMLNGLFKSRSVQVGNHEISLFDLRMQMRDHKRLKELAESVDMNDLLRIRNDFSTNFLFFLFLGESYEYIESLVIFIWTELTKVQHRLALLKKLSKVEKLREAIPLPYELLLIIVKYFENIHLEAFIDAFYESN